MGLTAKERVSNQRARRRKAGWKEVRVWVPTAAAAKEIQKQAALMRKPYELQMKRAASAARLDAKIELLSSALAEAQAEKAELF